MQKANSGGKTSFPSGVFSFCMLFFASLKNRITHYLEVALRFSTRGLRCSRSFGLRPPSNPCRSASNIQVKTSFPSGVFSFCMLFFASLKNRITHYLEVALRFSTCGLRCSRSFGLRPPSNPCRSASNIQVKTSSPAGVFSFCILFFASPKNRITHYLEVAVANAPARSGCALRRILAGLPFFCFKN